MTLNLKSIEIFLLNDEYPQLKNLLEWQADLLRRYGSYRHFDGLEEELLDVEKQIDGFYEEIRLWAYQVYKLVNNGFRISHIYASDNKHIDFDLHGYYEGSKEQLAELANNSNFKISIQDGIIITLETKTLGHEIDSIVWY